MRFFRVADLVAQLEEALKNGTLPRLKRQIETCELLILDELGYVPFQKTRVRTAFSHHRGLLRTKKCHRDLEFRVWTVEPGIWG